MREPQTHEAPALAVERRQARQTAADQRHHVDIGHRCYYLASTETRFNYGLTYLGLAGFLAVMCDELHRELPRGF